MGKVDGEIRKACPCRLLVSEKLRFKFEVSAPGRRLSPAKLDERKIKEFSQVASPGSDGAKLFQIQYNISHHPIGIMKTVILDGGLGARICEETHLNSSLMIEIGGMPKLPKV